MQMHLGRRLSMAMIFLLLMLQSLALAAAPNEKNRLNTSDLVRGAVRKLVKAQDVDGRWAYECVALMGGSQLLLGHQVANTSIVAETLLLAAPDDADAQAAVQRGLMFVLKRLHDPEMAKLQAPEDANELTMENFEGGRVWGHAFALEFLCHIRARRIAGEHEKEVAAGISHLVETLIKEELPTGGWNYMYSPHLFRAATHLTAPVAQALLLARSQGEKIPDALFARIRETLKDNRMKDGGFAYEKVARRRVFRGSVPESSARSAVCETTLVLLGGGSVDAIQGALNNFFNHWDKLECRRQKDGTHEGPYEIAPYYFYYGHRYAAQAIQMLPEAKRAKEHERLLTVILKTRDANGTWNDRIYERDWIYGTAMVVQALLGDKMPLPPRLAKK